VGCSPHFFGKKRKEKGLTPFGGDAVEIEDRAKLAGKFANNRFDAVINLADLGLLSVRSAINGLIAICPSVVWGDWFD